MLNAARVLPDESAEEHLPIRAITFCKSLFDSLTKDASLPEDRGTTLTVASLRERITGCSLPEKCNNIWKRSASRNQLTSRARKVRDVSVFQIDLARYWLVLPKIHLWVPSHSLSTDNFPRWFYRFPTGLWRRVHVTLSSTNTDFSANCCCHIHALRGSSPHHRMSILRLCRTKKTFSLKHYLFEALLLRRSVNSVLFFCSDHFSNSLCTCSLRFLVVCLSVHFRRSDCRLYILMMM